MAKRSKRRTATRRAKLRVKIRTPKSKPHKQTQQRKKQVAASRQLSKARRTIAAQREVIKELQRRETAPRRRFDFPPDRDDGDDAPEAPFIVPPGARVVAYDEDGEPSGFELDAIMSDFTGDYGDDPYDFDDYGDAEDGDIYEDAA